jgi:hypothetical protein
VRALLVSPARSSLAIVAFLAACGTPQRLTVQDLRGRRIVPLDRPTLNTEFARGRRTIRIDREREPEGRAGFSLAIELADLATPASASAERLLEFPTSEALVMLVVAGDRWKPFWSGKARGRVRLRELEDDVIVVVDLEFDGPQVADGMKQPVNVFQEDARRLRVTGSFEAEKGVSPLGSTR